MLRIKQKVVKQDCKTDPITFQAKKIYVIHSEVTKCAD